MTYSDNKNGGKKWKDLKKKTRIGAPRRDAEIVALKV